MFAREQVDRLVLRYLHIDAKEADLSHLEDLVQRDVQPQG